MIKKLILLSIILTTLVACAPKVEEVEEVVEPVVEEPKDTTHKFNGSTVENQTYHAIAVMIGNTSEARPQSGLSLADIVYEISVETMTITRYMAIFASDYPDKVGPIRSVRIPFVNVLHEWDIGIAHYGGSSAPEANALKLLENTYVPIRYDGVEGINTDFFSRDSARIAPHNAYMDMKEASTTIPDMWPRKHFSFNSEASYTGEVAKEVHINYTSSIRNGYVYNETLGLYEKYLNDKPQIDAYNDQTITASNIIVQHAKHSVVGTKQYVLVEPMYSGVAEYFINGTHVTGRWVKDFADDITHWYDANDTEIEFQPGHTWIHIVPDSATISYK